MSEARERAQRLLNHHLTSALAGAGFRVTGDTCAEIDEIVDSIIEAAVDEVARRREERIAYNATDEIP